jgi:hypothetical protein
VRFYSFRPVPLFFTFIFTPNDDSCPISLSAIHFPPMAMNLLRSPWALGHSSWFEPHLDHYPQSLGVKAVLALPSRLSRYACMTNSPSFLVVSHFIYFDGFFHLSSFHNHTDFVIVRFTADEELWFMREFNIPSPKSQSLKKVLAPKHAVPC